MPAIERSAAALVPSALAFVLAACAGAGGAASTPTAVDPPLSAATYERHVATLASDAFEGRKPATAGEARTLEYLTGEFRRLGLEPGHRGGFLQEVPVVEITAGSDARLAIGGEALRIPDEAVIWTKRVVPQMDLAASPLVFVGYGVVAPEQGWNDYAGVDMRGKTALILINDPGFATGDETLFRGRALTYYGRWTYKLEEAARQGAAAAIIVHETEPAAYPWETVVNSWTGPQLDKASPTGNAERVSVEGWITSAVAERLLGRAGHGFADLKARANTRGFRPVPLPLEASATLRNAIRKSSSSNVVAVLPGTKRSREYVIYMAHWDHLGRSFAVGDNIFNGAVDNATGTAGLLTIAEGFVRSSRAPERSIVFLALTLEESGLLGSEHYVANPPFPLEQTVAAINMDALYFGGPTRDVSVVGYGASELDGYLAAAARAQGRELRPEPTPEKGFFYRSDHFNFAKRGVPALYIKSGVEDLERGAEWAREQHEEFIALRYHKPGDEYRPGVDLRGSLQDFELLRAVGARLARERSFPNWAQDSEFRAIRDRSRAILQR
jgi:Zn-dependent M28 family amino/carboxypeptidase